MQAGAVITAGTWQGNTDTGVYHFALCPFEELGLDWADWALFLSVADSNLVEICVA